MTEGASALGKDLVGLEGLSREQIGPRNGDIRGARLTDRFIVDPVRVDDLIDAGQSRR